MSTKTLKKELLAAVAMLIVAAIALSGSTFAWFAANNKVTATGMTVTAKSDTTFLQIENASGASANSEKTSASATNASATIYPAEYAGTGGSDAWKYGYSKTVGSSALDTSIGSAGYFNVPDGQKDNYRLANTYKLYTKQTTEGTSKGTNLKVATCKVTGTGDFLDAVKLVVVCGSNVQEISCQGKTTGVAFDISGATTLAAQVTEKSVGTTDVNVYVYFDGNNSHIKTDSAIVSNLTAMQVELTFTCETN